MTGEAGHDTYIIDDAGDTVTEAANEGNDTIHSSVSYTLSAHVEHLTLTGGAGISGSGNGLNNVLTGNSAANVLAGGLGNDTYVVGAGDTVIETTNEGTDTVKSAVSWTLGDNLENLTLTGSTPIHGTGNTRHNVLTGNRASNVLAGGIGNDTLKGNGGNDTYLFNRGDGRDRIVDSDSTTDNTDTLLFGSDICPTDLMLSRQANDLRLAIYGSHDQVTIQNWYADPANQTESIQAGNGQCLANTQVEQLIQAMAAFSTETGLSWEQALAERPQDVQLILAANWQ
jgi:Ca2+-binding RTX toxin-like protein